VGPLFFLSGFPISKIQFPEQAKNLAFEVVQPEINPRSTATDGMDFLAVYFPDIMLQRSNQMRYR
jgi:hypothetical protein